MMNKEEVLQGLRQAKVADAALHTTLPLEGQDTLRSMVQERSLLDGKVFGVFMYPNTPNAAVHTRKIFHTLAKEMFLSGVSVYCLSLVRLSELLLDTETSHEFYMIENVRMVFITDMYEAGAVNPLTPYAQAAVRNWVRERIEGGRGVSCLSDAPLSRVSGWWSTSFISQLENDLFPIGIAA